MTQVAMEAHTDNSIKMEVTTLESGHTTEVAAESNTEDKEVDTYKAEIVLDVQKTDKIVAITPSFMTDEEVKKIQEAAKLLADQIISNPTDVEVISVIYALGGDAMEANTVQTSLIETKVGPVMANISPSSPVNKNLLQIKSAFDLITPTTVSKEKADFESKTEQAKYFFKFLGTKTVTEIVKRLPIGDKEVMALINERKDSVGDTINGIKRHLLSEKDIALRQAVELGRIANHLFDTQEDLQVATYQGQLIWEYVNAARETETDPVRNQALMYVANDLGMLVVDIQSVDQMNMQTRLGAETLINNCRGIQSLVSRITNRLLPAVQTQLVVKAAGMQQASLAASSRDVIAAANATMESTAKDIGVVSVQIAEMNAESMLDMAALERTQAAYEETQTKLLSIMNEAETNARGISNRMSEINKRSRQHADPMTRARQAREKALAA